MAERFMSVGLALNLHLKFMDERLTMTIANELPKGLVTEDEILSEGFKLMKEKYGFKSAKYYFYYHEDYPSDLINEYIWLQQEEVVL